MIKAFTIPSLVTATAFLLVSCSDRNDSNESLKMIDQVDFSHVTIEDSFWSPRLDKHKTVTQAVCIDQIENKTGRIRNFENAAKGEGEHSGIFFDDSDVYKAVEGMAYSLINHPDPTLEAKADEWISKFAAAQQPDGYINTYYTLTGLDKRWTDMDRHEMYCAGHLTEAAVAYYKATGKREFLDVAIRMADHIMSVFGPEKRHWIPGHEEIELALVKLYETTGERKYLDFAHWLLEERGHGFGVYGSEFVAQYYQDQVPVKDLERPIGHAVRCMYLFCGMADVASIEKDSTYVPALMKIWDVVVGRNMYITGGIGQSCSNEGFTRDYSLPNKEAYCETCASIGMVLWNQRMNQLTGDARFADVVERCMYNGVISGLSLSGDHFFYVNPLESDGDHHRQEWYGCACCPSNLTRFLPSIGSYIYGVSKESFYVNLFIGSKADFEVDGVNVNIRQETSYPWNGRTEIKINTAKALKRSLKIRIPEWCKSYTLSCDGKAVEAVAQNGYVDIAGWKKSCTVVLDMDMEAQFVNADPRVLEDAGMSAVTRGPLVYCMEETDNKEAFAKGWRFSENASLISDFDPELLDGIETVTVKDECGSIKLIPYYAWDNREAGKMKVWN